MRTMLAAALLMCAGLCAAQGKDPAATPAKDGPNAAVNPDAATTKAAPAAAAGAADEDALKGRLKDLHAQHKAAMEAVKADATKTPEQKQAALRKIHEDFRAKRQEVHDQMRAAHSARRPGAGTPRENPPERKAAKP
ncbi:MAG: hypothetical protein HY079_02920 [Elusimicrobia bacterium]|nr:hypothetical protein [Elusimicrobiota bacterium]